jgi:hypothetical protein
MLYIQGGYICLDKVSEEAVALIYVSLSIVKLY